MNSSDVVSQCVVRLHVHRCSGRWGLFDGTEADRLYLLLCFKIVNGAFAWARPNHCLQTSTILQCVEIMNYFDCIHEVPNASSSKFLATFSSMLYRQAVARFVAVL